MDARPNILWSKKLSKKGLGGLSCNDKVVMVSGRDLADMSDIFYCIDQRTGEQKWAYSYPADCEEMDYGKSPRATPLIVGDRVVTLGAMGDLACLDIETGLPIWTKNFEDDFDAEIPTWGFCGSPIMIDKKHFVVQPGSKNASLVAIELETGKVAWKSPGKEPSYSSFITANVSGKTQVIGYDKDTLGGWDAKTGKRLWTVTPKREGDFNVPTPIFHNKQIVVSSENNGTRIYSFNSKGHLNAQPKFSYKSLSPDTHTPVITAGKVFGISAEGVCLEAKDLSLSWNQMDDDFDVYAAAVCDGKGRVLVISSLGKLLLLDATKKKMKELGRMDLTGEEEELDIQSHPAFFGTKMFIRFEKEVVCIELKPSKSS